MEPDKEFSALHAAIRRAGAALQGKTKINAMAGYEDGLSKIAELSKNASKTNSSHLCAGLGGAVIGGVVACIGYGAHAIYQQSKGRKWADKAIAEKGDVSSSKQMR